jgi:arabinofuranan 3-O-arabinosyltransferase
MTVLTRVDTLAQRFAAGEGNEPDGIDQRLRERLRTIICCLALTALCAATRPGKIIADTKIDMAINPGGFLERALHIWDVEQFGQLQNQVAGYLFPMGPFYVIGHLAGLPPWIVQRLWLAALLCTAFLGARRLAERFAIGTPTTRLIAGLAYAVGPHGLASLGTNSSEYMPLAMLPWIVLPLVGAVEGGSRIKAAARSGIAIALCGGINGTATFAVFVVPVLYVLTRPRGTARVRILAWWGTAAAFATAWWLVPLVLLSKYAFSWLTYTEKADATTSTTGLVNVFRGTERWVNFLVVDGHAWWPVGHALATEGLPVLFTGVVAALGLAGLTRSRLPERTFLLVTLLAGVAIMLAGHTSVVESPLAPEIRHLIDGPLAAIRNLYKFDGLVRLPLAFGIGHLLATARRPRPRLMLYAATVLALAGVVAPAAANGLSASGDFQQVPQYWRDATAWLNGRAGNQGVLAVPGSRFGEYLWGRPMDEITQPLLTARWGERELVPAGSAGLSRILNAVDERITSGEGSAGLTEVLARMGIRYILVRNDLQRDDLRGAWPARVHQALDDSPGIQRVAGFGDVPAGGTWPNDAVNLFDQPYQPVEVYEVQNADDVVSMTDADQALRLYGSPETLLTMADAGLLKGRPVLLDGDGTGTGSGATKSVVSDNQRLVQQNFGEIREQTSPTLTEAEKPKIPAQDRDVLEPGWDRYSTVATYAGIKDITASSSSSDVSTISQLEDPGTLPYAAMDGNDFTQWETGGWSGPDGQWLQVDFDRPMALKDVSAAFSQDPSLGPPPDTVSVQTQTGRIEQHLQRSSFAQSIQVPAGTTRWLRIRIDGLAWKPAVPAAARVAISELNIPGVHAVRQYRLPAPPAGSGPDTVVMSRSLGAQQGCMLGSMRWVCSPSLARQDDEGYGFDRLFSEPVAGAARMTGTATLTNLALVEQYTDLNPRVSVSASSSLVNQPADQARSAFDGDPKTSWVASTQDRAPTLTLTWKRGVRLGQITVTEPPDAPGPLQIQVEGAGGQSRTGSPDSTGRLRFAPMTTNQLTLRFTVPQLQSVAQPLQITDVKVPGVAPLASPGAAPFTLPCGYGPQLTLNGVAVPTRAGGTYADLLASRPIQFQACGNVTVGAGQNQLVPVPLDSYLVNSVVVDPNGLAALPPRQPSTVAVSSWTPEHRQVEVDAKRQSYLTVNENFNKGWQAKVDGVTLRPVRVDGWRQAWVVPTGTIGTVTMSYGPDLPYRAAVLFGLNLLVVLFVAAVWPSRRRPKPVSESLETGVGFAGRTVALVVAAALGFWIAGMPGVAATVAAALVAGWAPLRLRPLPWLVAVAMLAGTVSYIAGMWLTLRGFGAANTFEDVVPQLLGLVVVGCLVMALCPRREDVPPVGEP